MSRIYLNNENQFCIWSRNSDSEKVAFIHEEGVDLRTQIEAVEFDCLLEGWSKGQILEDLLEGGFVKEEKGETQSPYARAEFFQIGEGVSGNYWAHVSGVAKYFSIWESAPTLREEDDRSFQAKGTGNSRMTRKSAGLEAAKADFLDNPLSWKSYTEVYDRGARRTNIVF